jgi:HEAT repeat protein
VAPRQVLGFVVALSVAGAAAVGRPPQRVVRYSRSGDPLAARMEWALKEAARHGYNDGFWAAYSIRRLMSQDSSIGTFSSRSRLEATLQEIISGDKPDWPVPSREESIRSRARQVIDDLEKAGRPEKKVWNDVAILVRYTNPAGAVPERVSLSSFNLSFDLEGRPLIWLGEADDEESLAWLKKAYPESKTVECKEQVLAAVGIHESPAAVIPILDSVLKSQETAELRKNAAFWLGQQNDRKAYEILLQTAKTDRSGEVREGAVFAISQVELEVSVDGLIDLARHGPDPGVRKQAVFWLGQKASLKAAGALEGFAFDSREAKIQEQAVFALSQLPGRAGLDALIKVAKTHPNAGLRKKAVFWLSECHDPSDPRALNALIEIIKGK